MKRILLSLAFLLMPIIASAQFTVIRGVSPSNAFVNINSDAQNNLAVNCVQGCGASGGTGGLAPNGSAVSGNPVLTAGYDGTLTRTFLTDTSGRQAVTVFSLPSIPAGANAIGSVSVSALPSISLATGANTIGAVTISGTPAVTISGTPAVSISGTPAVTLTSTTLSGTANNVVISPSTTTLVDHSGTITTGGTSQTLSAAKSRKYFMVQNTSSANLYINFTSAASAATGSIQIPPGGSFFQEGSFVSSELIAIFGATTGQTFTSKDL